MTFKTIATLITLYCLSLFNTNTEKSFAPPPMPPVDEFDLSQPMLPPSPTAAEFAKYGDIPVDLSSGVPSISVPMYTLQGRGLSVPISLSYHASGVRVDDISSMVGMSWSLNSGGVVTRTVRGNPDEFSNGYMNTGNLIPYPFDYPEDLNWLYFYVENNTDKDGQPDLFSFNVGGISGKFFFEGDGSIRTMPHQNLKIEFETHQGSSSGGLISGAIAEIKITSPDGLVYIFGGEYATEISKTSSLSVYGDCNSRTFEEMVPTSWYLKKIYNPNTNDAIDFTYQQHGVAYYLGYNETHNLPSHEGPLGGCTGYSYTKCITKKDDAGVHITEINSSFGKVTFEYNDSNDPNDLRLDIITGTNQNGVRLDNVKIFGATDSQNPIRRFVLEQDYWYATTGNAPSNSSSLKYRMYLKSVTEYGAEGGAKPPHQFFYNNGDGLPPRLSYDQDHWGFYNGAGNTTLTPEFLGGNGSQGHYAGADREIDPEKTQYGLLNKIIYPTGGETLFDYFGSYQVESEVEETIPIYIGLNRRQFCPEEDGDEDDCDDFLLGEELFTLDQQTDVTIFRKEIIRNDVAHPGGPTYARLYYDDGGGSGYIIYPNLEPYNVSGGSAPDDDSNGSGDDYDINQESSTYSLPSGDYKMEVRASAYHHNEAIINVSYDEPTGDTITIDMDYCGLRVKKITSDGKLPNPDPVTVKTYDYEVDDWVLQGTMPIYFRENTVILTNAIPCSYDICKFYNLSSSSVNRTNKNGGGNIFYRKVTEEYGENGEFGSSYNEFSFEPDGDPELGPTGHFPLSGTPGIDNSWKCGHLLHQIQYDENGQAVQETINDYSFEDVNHDYSTKAIVVRKEYEIPCPPIPQVICDNDITDAEFNCSLLPCWSAFENKLNNYIENEANFIAVFHTDYTITNNTLPQAALDILDDITPLFPPGCAFTVNNIIAAVTNGEITGTHDLAYIIDRGTNNDCYWFQTSPCLGHEPGDTIVMQGGLDGWAIEYYDVNSSWVKLNSTTSIVDGVETITDYEYDNTIHLNPTATVVTNSDGSVHRTETKYAHEVGNQSMIDKHMHSIPLETRSLVGGTLVGGKITTYEDVTFSGEVDINGDELVLTLPGTVTQILHDNTTLLRATVLDYDSHGNMTSFTKEPASLHDPITIEWTSDLPTKKTFIGWEWQWDYDYNTRLQTVATNIDDIQSGYEYDEFQRLTEATARNGGITESYSYHLTLAGDPTTPNHIIHSSSATGVTTYQYSDGLGRGKEAVKVAYSPDKEDVVTGDSLDAMGRPVAQHLPFLGPGNGTYVTPSGLANIIDYEDSPLGRETARVFAGGGTVSQAYSSNAASEVKKFEENGTQNGFYETGKLYRHDVTDENGNTTSTFTDIVGRTILVRQFLDTQPIDTYNVYDDRGNLVYVIPPGANSGSDPLSYEYEYDERNRLESKKIPGAEAQTFTYNDKDELVTSTDGNLTTLTNTYNAYGQMVSTAKGGNSLIYNSYSSSGSSTGKVVSTDVALLDGNYTQLTTSFSYDNVGRVETTTAQNHIGGNDIITNYYDGGTDRITKVRRNHTGFESFMVSQIYDFDHVKRLTDVWHRIDNGEDVRLSNNNYDFKDRLIEKNIGGGVYGRYLQSVDYRYNLRNWLTHINQLGEGGHPIESCDPLPEQETEVFCGDSEISLEDLLRLRREIDDLNIDCYDPCAAINEQIILQDTVHLPEQEVSLLSLDSVMATASAASMSFPTSMYHVKLLDEKERLVLEEELPIIQGGYLTDQCKDVTSSSQNFDLILDTAVVTKNLGELLTIRQSETPRFETPDCEDDTTEPSCGEFSESFSAHSINSSTIFSAPGPPLTDLSQFPGAENSLENDGVDWQLNGYTEGEAEWDIHSSISTLQGTTVSSYKVSIEVTEEIITEGVFYLGLHDGNGFVKVNGGLDYISGYDAGVFVLTPDSLPTAQQTDNMVLAYELAGNISIDAVWVDIDYEVSCDCYVTPPDCELTPEQEALALENIVYLEPNQVSFPTKLYRIMLCDGSEMYLLADELATFTGTYIIIQEIDITSPSQTFLADTLGLDRADIFAMRLYYDEPKDDDGTLFSVSPQLNGNIANIYWQTNGRNQQVYAFTYDDLNRLKRATYFDKTGLLFSSDNKYGVPTINYDLRGNITALNRNGLTTDCPSQQYGAIDLLTYSYNTENQITGLTDAADITRGFKKPGQGGTYTYDDNGNMTRDPNKGIDIDYNIMNLPDLITFDTGEEIEFLYDAAGTKLQKIANDGTDEITKDYVGGIEYVTENSVSVLEAVYHEEGRAIPEFDEITGDIESFNYEYSIKDHLGNSRITFSDLDENGKIKIGGDESEILQENHYYPFGMNMEGNWVPQIGLENAYQYNGKELNEDFGLDWSDYGARWYDASIGRWNAVDPLANKFSSHSPYHYTYNNPIKFYDPDGKDIFIYYKEAKLDKNGNEKKHKRGKRKGETKMRNKRVSYSNAGDVDNEFVQNTVAALDYASERDEAGIISTLTNSKKLHANIRERKTDYSNPSKPVGGTQYEAAFNSVFFDPLQGLAGQNNDGSLTGEFLSPAIGLLHELDHRLDALTNPMHMTNKGTFDRQYGTAEERRAIQNSEQRAGEGYRTNHFGFPYQTTGSTTRQGDFSKIKDQALKDMLKKKGHN